MEKTFKLLRGLDARLALAKAKVAAVTHGLTSQTYQLLQQEALVQALNLGRSEFYEHHGRCDVPLQFKSEEQLAKQWTFGWSQTYDREARVKAFDTVAWEARCQEMAKNANRGCGLIYELFVSNFSANVNAALKYVLFTHHEQALVIARRYGYASPEELARSAESLADDGCCSHGLDPYNCPVGCGDIEN